MHGSSLFTGLTRTGGRCGSWRHEPGGSGQALRRQPLLGDPLEQAGGSTGSPAALPMGGKKPFALTAEEAWIRARVVEKPDITGRELLAELTARGVTVSYYGVWHFLDHVGLSFKKKPARQRTGSRRRCPPAPAVEGATGHRLCGAADLR